MNQRDKENTEVKMAPLILQFLISIKIGSMISEA